MIKLQILFIVFFIYQNISCQSISIDSISNNTFDKILSNYYSFYDNGNMKLASYYAKLYLTKAKISKKNKIEHIYGHHFISEISEFKNAIKHLDTIIILSEQLKDKSTYPGMAYLLKGSLYYDKKDFKNALDNYLLALKESKVTKNEYLETTSNNSIGLMKLERTGSEQEAIDIFRECLKFYKKDDNENFYSEDYLILNYSFSEGFRYLKNLDSSSHYNIKGIFESIKYNDVRLKNYFIFSEGINQFLKGNSKAALDSLYKSYKTIEDSNDKANQILSNYYIGKIHLDQGELKKGKIYFAKMDSIYEKSKVYIHEIRKAYEYQADLAKGKNNLKDQLLYVNKILKLDSLNLSDYKSLSTTLRNKYDNQSLLDEKSELIMALSKTNRSSQNKSLLLYFGILLLGGIYYYFYKKNRKFKKQFEKVISKKDAPIIIDTPISNKKLNIPDDVIEKILNGLLTFEIKKGYLKHNLTSFDLAKDLGTNKKYLTNIIKTHKKKTFPAYLNDLRIKHAIERLKNEKIFRNYTVLAISEEVGFSNSISFSQAFIKYTNIKPSQFIKEIKRTKDS